MILESTLQQLLGFGPSWEVVRVDYKDSVRTFYITVKDNEHLWRNETCPHCQGRQVTCYDHVAARSWRHLNIFNNETVIGCSLPRGRCGDCGHIYRVKPPWEGKSKHFTKDFDVFVLTLMREMPVKKVSKIVGETDQRLWRMLFANVETAHADLSMEAVKILRQQWNKPLN